MNGSWLQRLTEGLGRTREQLSGQLNVLMRRGPDLDEEFWSELEDALIGADMGVTAVTEIVERLRDSAARRALPDAEAVIDHLAEEIAAELTLDAEDFLETSPVTVLLVGVNGTGKTTTLGKIAKQASDAGRRVLLGSADTFRAAADEQLAIWSERAGVPVVRGERGTDPAAVAFDTLARARETGADLVLIDTAGRLHTKTDLMEELAKVRRVVERESEAPVRVLMVLDATTGQNGLVQAKRFDETLGLDGIALTKLDGTAKGGIALAVVRELGVPVLRIGVGEGVDDLRPFVAAEFARALVGR
ncbi:MAG: signal recognition particle-docking protein FtsY [Coriobacteriaceae bacterium]|nr:signal recognition particle-docking protein FtsY [Coriobacteriaceae bacterium]